MSHDKVVVGLVWHTAMIARLSKITFLPVPFPQSPFNNLQTSRQVENPERGIGLQNEPTRGAPIYLYVSFYLFSRYLAYVDRN